MGFSHKRVRVVVEVSLIALSIGGWWGGRIAKATPCKQVPHGEEKQHIRDEI